MISREQIEKVQNTADIVDIIGERIDVKRAGSNYKARCPFHDEKTPSFMISSSKQIFKCFGCGASGDSIKFVMMYDNVSYPDAIRHIATKYGIEIVETYGDRVKDPSSDDKKELLRILNKNACDFFHENLIREYGKENSGVIKYLNDRKIDREYADKFMLGYAQDDWQLLVSDQRFSVYNDDVLVEAGLRKKNEKGNVYDQFRNRLIFPIYDQMGNVVAFSGRTLDDEIPPKYLNSPETSLYKKTNVLYGLYQAMDTIRKSKEIILVEGNIDLISMHKFGFTNTVAICGTAFTESHALLIKRNSDKITVLLDGDEPGRKSALRTSEILISCGVIPSIVILPEESDPDSFLYERGSPELKMLMDDPMNIVELSILLHRGDNPEDPNSKVSSAKAVIGTLKKIKDMITLDLFMKEAALKLGIDLAILKKELLHTSNDHTEKNRTKHEKEQEYIARNDDMIEFSIAYLMLSDETSRKKFLTELSEEDFKNDDISRLFRRIYELFEEGEQIKLNNILFDFDEKFKDFMIGFVIEQDRAFSGDTDNAEIETQRKKMEKAFSDNLFKMKARKIGEKIKNLNSELKYTADADRQNQILNEISGLKKQQKEFIKK
ncbi:TPA: DNA primase [Candidatus Delongbacteria bacterium]|nr:MAG: DNA primase [Candidatus Delongbacteria bacterium GWF2_40_14]HAQ60941.1 DNA primase [Candidatus Delongbacteria bacterium]